MNDVRLHRLARQDLVNAALSYEEKQAGLGDKFVDAASRTFDSITFMPEAGILHETGMRMRIVKPFTYGVLYRSDKDEIVILAIGHLNRKPEFWTERVGDIE